MYVLPLLPLRAFFPYSSSFPSFFLVLLLLLLFPAPTVTNWFAGGGRFGKMAVSAFPSSSFFLSIPLLSLFYSSPLRCPLPTSPLLSSTSPFRLLCRGCADKDEAKHGVLSGGHRPMDVGRERKRLCLTKRGRGRRNDGPSTITAPLSFSLLRFLSLDRALGRGCPCHLSPLHGQTNSFYSLPLSQRLVVSNVRVLLGG